MKMFGCAAILLSLAWRCRPMPKAALRARWWGATVGHFAGHHGVLGAAAGCIIGRHEAIKAARQGRVVQQPSTAGPR